MLFSRHFHGLFSKSGAKVRLFFQTTKFFSRNSPKIIPLPLLSHKNLANSQQFRTFAHCNRYVQ
jgi:hypothetical protein